MTLRKKSCTEDRQVSQTMDGDRNQKALFSLVGDCKYNAADNLSKGEIASGQMGQNK